MFRWLVVLFGFLITTETLAAGDISKVLGVWKLVAYDLEFQDTGERRPVFGKKPVGYIIFASEGRMTAYLEAENRKSPANDLERAAAFRTMIAYSGKYRLEGDKWITKVDASWNVAWVGTDQERFFKFDGKQLHVISQWIRSATYDNRMVRGYLIWERE